MLPCKVNPFIKSGEYEPSISIPMFSKLVLNVSLIFAQFAGAGIVAQLRLLSPVALKSSSVGPKVSLAEKSI